jgi:hypothetical protein
VSQAILGNVGTTIIFQVGPNDSRRLANMLLPYTPTDAENLDKYQALVKMRVEGKTFPCFDIKTLPLEAPADEAALDQIREQSRNRFTSPKDQLHKRSVPPAFAAAFSHDADEVEED